MEDYRRAVEDAIRTKAQMACVLSEDWTGGFDDTLRKCTDRVLASRGFFLLLGFYYGWVPSGERSITHIEFECAFNRWKSLPYPPMAVFASLPDSDADRLLKTEAEKLVPKDPTERALHDARLQSFRSEVLGAGRTAQFYKDEGDLRENAIVSCLCWNGLTPLAAAQTSSQTGATAAVSEQELGSLGRRQQFDAVESVLAQFNAEPEQPCTILLVSGEEDAGQRAFLQCLARSPLLANYRPNKPGHPPTEHYDLGLLGQWIGSVLGISVTTGVVDARRLADLIAVELQTQPLFFMLDRLQGLAGSLQVFISEFWHPLRSRLLELHQQKPLPNRLLAFATDYQGVEVPAQFKICEADDLNLDFSTVVRLPTLADFGQQDVILWLNKIGVSDQPPGRRKQIAASVLKNASGDFDAKPLRVFERLRGENLFEE